MTYKKREDTGTRRPDTRFHVFAEQWLWGSTRSELEHDERAILIDLLSLAAFKGGTFEIFKREQTASQLCAPVELLNRTLEKCVENGKLLKTYKKREKKEIFTFKNWKRYQPHYLHTRPEKHGQKTRSAKDSKRDASHSDLTKQNKTELNKTELNKTQGSETDVDVFIKELCRQYNEQTGTAIEYDNIKAKIEKLIKDGEEKTTIIEVIQKYFDFLDEKRREGFDQKPKELHNFLYAWEDMKRIYHK